MRTVVLKRRCRAATLISSSSSATVWCGCPVRRRTCVQRHLHPWSTLLSILASVILMIGNAIPARADEICCNRVQLQHAALALASRSQLELDMYMSSLQLIMTYDAS